VDFFAAQLQAIVILEAYTEGKNQKRFRLQFQSCGFARVPKVGKITKKKLNFFFDFFKLFLGDSTVLSSKKMLSKFSHLCQTTNGCSKHQKTKF
jgi:hypothetical protein